MSGADLSGPTVADTRIDPDIYEARIEFRVLQQGWAARTIVMSFQDPAGEAEAHLLALWRIWYARQVERAQAANGIGDVPLA